MVSWKVCGNSAIEIPEMLNCKFAFRVRCLERDFPQQWLQMEDTKSAYFQTMNEAMVLCSTHIEDIRSHRSALYWGDLSEACIV